MSTGVVPFCPRICNLTADADRLRMGEGAGAPRAMVHDRLSATIVTAATVDRPAPAGDMLYVVMAGYGIIEHDGDDIDFTMGDVLFVPAAIDHRFAGLSPRFKAWSIALHD